MYRTIILFSLLLCTAVPLLSQHGFNGSWKRLGVPGPDPCASDMIIDIESRYGTVNIWYGSAYEECAEEVESFDRWSVNKEEVITSRGLKKINVLYLHSDGEEPIRMEALEVNRNFMKLRMIIYYDEEDYEEQEIIFKRI